MSLSKTEEEKMMLRAHYRSMRQKMTEGHKRGLDLEITARVLCSSEYMESKLILAYSATRYEIETVHLIRAALLNKKQVALPRCEDDGIMRFYLINSLDDLECGSFGIMEPKAECKPVSELSDALCIVPGLSFDPEGNRLGYGKGYYDRFLKNFKGVSMGLCYASFIKWNIPALSYDVPVGMLATDRYIRRTAV